MNNKTETSKTETNVSAQLKVRLFPVLILALFFMPMLFQFFQQSFIKPWADEIERSGKHVSWQDTMDRVRLGVFGYVAVIALTLFIVWLTTQLRRYFAYKRSAAEREKNFPAHLNSSQQK